MVSQRGGINPLSSVDARRARGALIRTYIPADQQARLRDKLIKLTEDGSGGLTQYLAAFRNIIQHTQYMSAYDKMTYFIRGLCKPTKAAVQFARPTSMHEAMATAQEYAWSHRELYHSRRQDDHERHRSRDAGREHDGHRDRRSSNRPFGSNPSPKPRVSGNAVDQKDPFHVVALKQRLCFNCHGSGHNSANCKQSKRAPGVRPKLFRSTVSTSTVKFKNHQRVQSDAESDSEVDVFSCNMARLGSRHGASSNLLLWLVVLNGQDVVALVDSGANHNMFDATLVNQDHHVRQRVRRHPACQDHRL
ncbi:hypothetical protein ACHHYP_12151 [Achlya hypogyna]|uniref:CCHC-type domain-containing protein n=1 Tax=Achlya hypogyna TaxID=1202772 RepID=A0A1V9YHN8_ACHHY|nr:hypothetical protein ACHHYP_12151 [Achlya hypogyna]